MLNKNMDLKYDVIVVGGGHAGCEAALAAARKGHNTLMLSVSLDNIAYMACNPSVGGTGKGHLVREIDALGGEMGVNADKTLIQLRMLNSGKGAAVQSLRAQTDKYDYHYKMKSVLESTEKLSLRQAEVVEVLTESGKVLGIKTVYGEKIFAPAVVLACGVYLNSEVIIGEYSRKAGPAGFNPAQHLTKNLKDLGFEIRRFKTGTPARVDGRTINYDKMERQDGENGAYSFSFLTRERLLDQVPCYLTYTTEKTHEIIRKNLSRAPMYSGQIKGTGTRYCPAIETKVVRFADKERHQIFIEPEGKNTTEAYIQGMSTSMPADVQIEMYRSIIGLENSHITRYAYAIEYDCINPLNINAAMRSKQIEGLYMAGQINGTSGYEEAAAQGLIAGINASLFLEGKESLILSRSDAYIGVLIDDLVTKGTNEPYRMMTSRAEYRLKLRQDNADLRLTEIGRSAGLVSSERYDLFLKKKELIEESFFKLKDKNYSPKEYGKLFNERNESLANGLKLYDMLKRPNICLVDIIKTFNVLSDLSQDLCDYIESEIKYEGYLKNQNELIKKMKKLENETLPETIDYNAVKGLRIEARQKLSLVKPRSLGQAANISGVSPADIAVLMIYLKE
ncbi:glucose inhibited division protein a [Holotrichia oblita]|nr:glucose inhibited division protein a [Holotrichia oblita]